MVDKKVCLVVGIGPGTGEAAARAFFEHGFAIAGMARSADKLGPIEKDLGALGVPCDVTDLDALKAGLARVEQRLGPVDTLLWNVGSAAFGTIDDVDVEGLERGFNTCTRGLYVAVQALLPGMRQAGGGNIIVTGATASLRGKPFTTAFAPGKAAQRVLAQALARHLGPEGIHVALVIVDGMIDLASTRARMQDAPDEKFIKPSAIASTMVYLAQQPKSAWTFEIDVRPHVETW